MDNFRIIDEIPPPYRNVFTEYPCFNAVQSQVLDDILYTDNSVVVSAPTGSGKTAIFELAIIRLLIQYENHDVAQKIKIVYISPIKALCHERLLDWHKKFGPFGLNCVTVTGDSDNMEFQHLTNHNLIISTPEKWDSLTRKWRDHEKIVKVVKLFMIDEVHLLNEENRGSTLEVIVSRMKTVENCVSYSSNEENIFSQKVRFIALSATVLNVEDIAEWIGKPPNIKFYRFSEDMRPVKLKKIVYGYSYNPKTTSPFKFDISLNYKLQSLMMQYSEGKPTLIFCSTRKSVEMTANHIVQTLRIHLNEEQRQKLLDVADLISDSKAKATLKHGVGYHHAGMIHETRHAIENLFRNGDLPVLVTTSTLAMGVNLPAHLVIIKSTKCYDNGGFRDYTETAIHQMIGRAGRPQFDSSATALILTTNEDKLKFERMVGCSQPIESNLHRHLTEHLNAEVVLRTITDLDVAMQWLSSTFLYVRARKKPHYYGINAGFTADQIDRKLLEMCQIDLNKLVKSGMIAMDQNIIITPTVTGTIMAKYYVAFETMKLFTQITGTEILIQILALISKCQEFAPVRLRVNDKKTLNLLNKNSNHNTIRFPLNGKIKTWDMKVNCIIQAVLGNLEISDHSILSESLTIMRNGERLAKCLIEYLETKGTNCYSALLNTIILAKCFHAKLWENSPYVTKQLSGIGNVMSNQLANAGKTTFKKIMDSNPRDIEIIIKRKPPMGNVLIEEVEKIPIYKMTLEKLDNGKQLELNIILENADNLIEKSTVNVHSVMILLVGSSSNEVLVYEKYKHSYMMEKTMINKTIVIENADLEYINAHFISENWVGIDCNCVVEFQGNTDVQRTNKKVNVSKNNERGPTYIQMFLDMYMKAKKKTTNTSKSKEVETEKASVKKDSKLSGVDTEKEPAKENLTQIEKEKQNLTENKKYMVKYNEKNYSKPVNHALNDNSTKAKDTDVNKIEPFITVEEETSLNYTSNLFDDTDEKNKAKLSNRTLNDASYNAKDTNVNKTKSLITEEEESSVNDCPNLFETSLSPIVLNASLQEENIQLEDEIEKQMGEIMDIEVDKILKVANEDGRDEVFKEYENTVEVTEGSNEENDDVLERLKGTTGGVPRSSLIDFDEKVTKASSLHRMSQKYGPDSTNSKNKRKINDTQSVLNSSDSLCKQKMKKRQKLEEFRFPSKKKFAHELEPQNLPDSTVGKSCYTITQILEPSKKSRDRNESEQDFGGSFKERSKENIQKSITWRSPLVFSPAVKFSPKINYQDSTLSREDAENDAQNETNNETFETTSSKSNTNLRYANRKRTLFPLGDKAYDDTLNDKSDILDICSTQLIENFGLPINQPRFTPKPKKTYPSPALNYYSQLLSQPIQAQKRKIEGTPHKESENRTQSVNYEDKKKRNDIENISHKMYTQHPASDSDVRQNIAQMPWYPSQQMYQDRRENVQNQLQDMPNTNKQTPHGFILSQSKPVSYSNTEYFPQTDLNGTYAPQENYLQSRPTDYVQPNYEPRRLRNCSVENRFPNFVQNSNPDKFGRKNCVPIQQCCNNEFFSPQTCYDCPKIPYQRYPFDQNMASGGYRNLENFSRPVNSNFEHLDDSSLNHSRLYNNNFETDTFQRQRKCPQYFENNPKVVENFRQPILKTGNSTNFSTSQNENTLQRYPEMLSLQELNRQQKSFMQSQSKVLPNTPLVQRKSFEERMNEENTLRNMECGMSRPKLDVSQVSNNSVSNFMQNNPYFEPRAGTFQKRPSWESQREYFKPPGSSSTDFDYADGMEPKIKPERHASNFDKKINESIIKTLNRSLSFEEKPNFTKENMNFPQNFRLPEQIYNNQQTDMNNSFLISNSNYPYERNIQNPNFRYQNRFQEPHVNFNRPTMIPRGVRYPEQNYNYPSGNTDMENFPPKNDKEYVMNKFLYSFD